MKLKLKALILAAAMCTAALTATGCGRLEEIDPFDEQYISYQFSGVSGYTGEFMLDPRSAPLVLTTSYRSDYDKPLSNGDVVKLTVTPTEKLLKEAGYKLSRSEAEVVVEGLEEIPTELPEDAANTIIGDLKAYATDKFQDKFPVVGTEYNSSQWKYQSVSEPQLVRGLYEVTTRRNSADSAFSNDDNVTDESFSYLDEPTATFKSLWTISYTSICLKNTVSGKSKVGDVVENQAFFYSEISGFSLLDGEVHYNDLIEPYAYYNSGNEPEAFDGYFDSLSDKEHLAKVEY